MRVTRRSGLLGSIALGVMLAVGAMVSAETNEAESIPAWQTASWTQWRGPDRAGISTESDLIARWPEAGPAEIWRTPLGEGFSGISVRGGRLFTQFAAGADAFLVSLSAADGSEQWRVRTGASFKDGYGNGPRATPTLDGELVYALSSKGDLVAVRAADGTLVWRQELQESFGARIPQWGLSGSPLVDGDRLIVNAGGSAGRSVLAFAKASGKLLWSVRDEKAGYAAPVIVTVAGVRQLLVFAADRLVSLNPDDGTTYWEFGWKTDWGINAAMPIPIDDERIFISTGYDRGSVMLKLSNGEGGMEVEELWRNREMRNKFSSSVLFGGMLYGFDEGTLKCLDPEDGTTRWAERGLGHGTLLVAGEQLIVLSDRGKLVLARATPEAYDELSSTQAFKTKTWTVPTLAGGRLYVRDQKEIVALDLKR